MLHMHNHIFQEVYNFFLFFRYRRVCEAVAKSHNRHCARLWAIIGYRPVNGWAKVHRYKTVWRPIFHYQFSFFSLFFLFSFFCFYFLCWASLSCCVVNCRSKKCDYILRQRAILRRVLFRLTSARSAPSHSTYSTHSNQYQNGLKSVYNCEKTNNKKKWKKKIKEKKNEWNMFKRPAEETQSMRYFATCDTNFGREDNFNAECVIECFFFSI